MKKRKRLTQRSCTWALGLIFAIGILPGPLWGSSSDFYGSELIAKQGYKRISMDFKDADLKNVLKIFSQQAGLNFIASENVEDRVLTLYLDDVPLQLALNKIMDANNLTYVLDPGSNIFIVKEWGRPEVETITKIYPLKYARLKGSNLQTAIASGGGDEEGGAGGGGGGGGGGEEGLEATVSKLLTENGKLVVDNRTNSLIVTDIPSQFDIIDKIIAMLDVATPQVMIEVEMLDVAKETTDNLGMLTTPTIMALTGSSRETSFPFSTDNIANLAPPSFTYGTLSNAVFSATLELLMTDTRTKFLARPRILTLSNESAMIKITTDEAIGQNTVTTATGDAESTSIEAERFETGVTLKVTPQVDVDTGTVTMHIQPSVSEAKSGATFGGVTYKDPEIRSSSTTLRVKEGETIVVGGLIKTQEETTRQKVPFLGDIPFLGAVFRHKEKSTEEKELIVFITPHILDSDGALAMARADTKTSLKIPSMPHREQELAIERRKAVDRILKRWEN